MAASASATLSKGHRAEDFSVDGHGTPTPASRFHNKHFEVPRNASPVFTGREEIGKLLQARCLPSNTPDIQSQQRRFVIYGLGGSGKTQVCLKFAEDHRDK
ncbi:MAG: hypothetical protein LQ338_005714 [Usnochroma carphineum]|nr:MAG: hypothetical protein LQ338_005714 [Usnochroma carphineum]